MEESGPLSSKHCAKCGLTVAPGYVKCPRCHGELPVARVAGTRRATDTGGGTVMDDRPDPRKLAIIVGAVAIVGVIAWLVLRGDDDAAKAAVPDEDDTTDAVGDPADDDDDPDDRGSPTPGPGPTPALTAAQTASAARSGAIGGLLRELRGGRLWATVTGDDTTVTIDSAFCEDAGLAAAVSAAAGELRDAGFSAIRCRAPTGTIVFERGL